MTQAPEVPAASKKPTLGDRGSRLKAVFFKGLSWVAVLGAVAGVAASWWAWGRFAGAFQQAINIPSPAKLSDVGAWGDSFGAFNALISGLGFVAILATLAQQSRALKVQADDQHRQRFESSFFELLTLIRTIRSEFTFRYSPECALDRSTARYAKIGTASRNDIEAFRRANREIAFWLGKEGLLTNHSKEAFVKVYMKRVHSKSESTLSPYFRLIYSTMKRIKDDLILTDLDKRYYANVLRTQLTSPELTLMALNALAPIAKDLCDLIAYFHMLKYLPSSNMRRRLEAYYPAEAFSARD